MALIRPELTQAAHRFREALTGLVLAALGLWVGLGSGGILAWLGWAILAVGGVLFLAGVQRGRFRREGQGPGVVRVTEGQISYMGPLTGGAVAHDALWRLSLDPTGKPLHWRLDHDLGPSLMIPVTAAGADALFDAFEQLPGLDMSEVLSALERPPAQPIELWRRPDLRLS